MQANYNLTQNERIELQFAFENGYRFIIQDEDGHVYAHQHKPEHHVGCWYASNLIEDPLRLSNAYRLVPGLSDSPIDISNLLNTTHCL